MAHGGHRRGAGRKVGAKSQTTLAKALVEEAYRRYMLRDKEALWQAQKARATGAYILMEKKGDFYLRVTDPARIEQILARPPGKGRPRYLIEAQAADANLAKEINNRLMGVPTQLHEVGTADGQALPVRIVHQQEKG